MNNALNKLSLLAFITVQNSFNGMFMTEYLRVWFVNVDVRLDPRFEFTIRNNDLDAAIVEALDKVTAYYVQYHPELIAEGAVI